MGNKKLGWGDITLSKFQEISQLEPSGDEITDTLDTLSILTDKTYEELENEKIDTIREMMESYSFLKEIPEEKKIDVIEIDDVKYGLCDLNELTVAQFVDLEMYIKDGMIKNCHKILAILFLPVKKYNSITKKYEVEKYEPSEEREEIIKNVGMDQLYPTLLFFYRIVKVYSLIIQLYGLEMTQRETIVNGVKMKMMMKTMDEEQLKILEQKLKHQLENIGIGLQ